MRNAGLDEAQAGIKIDRRNINNLRYADEATLDQAESKEELKNLLMKVREESEKAGLKTAGALGRPRGMEWGGRREEGSGWGTHVYLLRIHFDIWQN